MSRIFLCIYVATVSQMFYLTIFVLKFAGWFHRKVSKEEFLASSAELWKTNLNVNLHM